MAVNLKMSLIKQLDNLAAIPIDELIENRYQRLMSYGDQ